MVVSVWTSLRPMRNLGGQRVAYDKLSCHSYIIRLLGHPTKRV
jgi:hypothetical protein